jgi:ferredoxin-NADP reductase
MGTTPGAIHGSSSDMPVTKAKALDQASYALVGRWQTAVVESVTVETYRAKTFRVSVPSWSGFRPGQHVDVRLTAHDGYQAQRSYSIASPPERSEALDLTVELVNDGEVSSWFHEIAAPGDRFELRGPIGGPFTWTVDDGGPLLLIAGGSGVVPLMSMLRHRHLQNDRSPAVLLYSSRTLEDVIYREELESYSPNVNGSTVLFTLTREQPQNWTSFTGRIDRGMIRQVLKDLSDPSACFICGPTAFVEGVAALLIAAGVEADRVRTERFGPSG